ncbi:polysaccharide deacetylase family protein [Actinomyces radicidentis]|nr:polysaccharide deacetylase family protein [Actinomyces radicidentis]
MHESQRSDLSAVPAAGGFHDDPDPLPAGRPAPGGTTPEPGLTGRRSLLRHGLAGAALTAAGLAVGGGAGAEAVHHLDTHLSPTARVAPQPSRSGRLAARVLFQTDPATGLAAITFDDGPDRHWTPMALRMLDAVGVPATFFVLGSAVADNPGLVRSETAAGHEVGVHNWVHTDVYGVDADELRGSLSRTITAIEQAGAPTPRVWRPPYGRVDAPALMVAAELDLDVLLWSRHAPSAADAADLATTVHAGAVVLCHDGRSQPNAAIFAALGRSITALKAEGLRFVTGSQMLAADAARASGTGSAVAGA